MSPSDPCSAPLRAPIGATGWLRPRLAPVAPPGLEKASFDVSPGPGADAPRLGTVAPSELEELSSPPKPKTCATRRKTALEWSGRGSNPQPQHCEGWGVWEFQFPRRWGGGLGRSDNTSTASPGGIVSIPSEVGRGSGSQHMQKSIEQISASAFQSPRRWGGVGLPGRCNDWPDMSLGSGFPYPPENGTKLGSRSLAPGSPEKRKRREQNRLGQFVTGARNRVN